MYFKILTGKYGRKNYTQTRTNTTSLLIYDKYTTNLFGLGGLQELLTPISLRVLVDDTSFGDEGTKMPFFVDNEESNNSWKVI